MIGSLQNANLQPSRSTRGNPSRCRSFPQWDLSSSAAQTYVALRFWRSKCDSGQQLAVSRIAQTCPPSLQYRQKVHVFTAQGGMKLVCNVYYG